MAKTGYTLAELGQLINAEVKGDSACFITGIASLKQAVAGQISFLDNARYRKYLPTTHASAVILAPADLSACSTPALVMDNPYVGYAKVTHLFAHLPAVISGIHPSAIIGEN